MSVSINHATIQKAPEHGDVMYEKSFHIRDNVVQWCLIHTKISFDICSYDGAEILAQLCKYGQVIITVMNNKSFQVRFKKYRRI